MYFLFYICTQINNISKRCIKFSNKMNLIYLLRECLFTWHIWNNQNLFTEYYCAKTGEGKITFLRTLNDSIVSKFSVYYSECNDVDRAHWQSGQHFQGTRNWNRVSQFVSSHDDRRILLVIKCGHNICTFRKDINTTLRTVYHNISYIHLLLHYERPIDHFIRLQHCRIVRKQSSLIKSFSVHLEV